MASRTYEVFLDGVVIGRVADPRPDFPWLVGEFEPTAAFEQVKSLFVQEEELLNAGDVAKWQVVRDELASRGLRVNPSAKHKGDLVPLVHIRGTRISWR
jgi:hypothetical protein